MRSGLAREESERRKHIGTRPKQTRFDASLLSSSNDIAGIRRALFSPERGESTNSCYSATIPTMAWLILLFIGSGCSALIYEIVWFQLLELVIGGSAVSMAVLLATFMAECVGAACVLRELPT